MPQRPVQPVNAVLVSGTPIYEEYEIEGTATECKPGRLVIPGTATYQCKIGTDNATTIIGVLDVMPDHKFTDAYAASDQVRVIRGDCVVRLTALHSATIAVGGKVQCAGNGKIDQYATATAEVGIAEEAFAAQASDGWIIVKLENV